MTAFWCSLKTQPNPVDVGELWSNALKEHDAVIYIPMSSGLSETCHTLQHYADTEEQLVVKSKHWRLLSTFRKTVPAIKLNLQNKVPRQSIQKLNLLQRFKQQTLMLC